MLLKIFLNEQEAKALAKVIYKISCQNGGNDGDSVIESHNLVDDEMQVSAASAILTIRAELGRKGIYA